MKNILVLKDLPSNIVDEAIVILKPNVKLKNLNLVDSKKNNRTENSKKENKDYIMDEAQMVIANYIGSIEEQRDMKYRGLKKKEKKQNVLRTALITLGILLVANVVLMWALQ